MPKVVQDVELHTEVKNMVIAIGSASKLASILDIDRTTFWRFCKTGKAIDKTREAIKQSILRNKSETIVEDKEPALKLSSFATGNLSEDVKVLRNLCTCVLHILDEYEKLLPNGNGQNYNDSSLIKP